MSAFGVARVCGRRLGYAMPAAVLLALATCGDALGQTRGSWNVDADGTWSVNSNWLNNTIPGGVSGTATFANDITATRTVTLDTNRSLGAFIFGDSGTSTAASWIVTSSTITPANGTNNVLLTVNALGTGATATISSILATSTSPSIAKEGVGTLVLGATNTFTNKLAINAGTLQVSADRNLGAVGTFAADRITISDGAILKTSTNFTLNANRGITVGSGTGTLNINGGALTLAAPVAGPGTMLVTGPNALTLQNASANVTSVNWDFSSNNSVRTFFDGVNALGTGSVRVRGGVRLTQTATTSGSGSIANAITLDSGAGLTARVANTYSNVIFPSSGTVQFNVDDQTTNTLTITSSGTLAGDLVVSTQQGGANAVGNVFLDGVFSGAGGLVKTGTGASGLLILRGNNTYTGTTAINTGTLQLGNGSTVGRLSASSAITGSAGGTLVFNRSDKIASGTDFNSVIGGGISVRQLGSGTVVLSSSSTYTGATSITNGTLEISNTSSLGPAPGSFTADHLQISGGAKLRTTAAVNLGQNRGVTVGTGTATLDINGGILQIGRFTGAGNTVAVTGSNSLSLLAVTTGTADVNWDFSMNSGQRVFFAGSNALGTGSVLVRNGIRLVSQSTAPTNGQVTNAITVENGGGLSARTSAGAVEYTNVTLPSSGSIVLNKDDQATAGITILSGVALTGGLTVDTSQGGSNLVGDVTLSGTFSGSGGLVKAGTGTSGRLILAGGNTYTGDTTINTGTLALGAAGSIANSAVISVASGATLDVSAVTGGFSLGAAQGLNGAGTVLGPITALGTISPGVSGGVGTLSFSNSLTLDGGAFVAFQLSGTDSTVGGGVNDLAAVTGDLTLDGTLNVSETAANSFLLADVGYSWRLFNYSGSLTNNVLVLGSMPALSGDKAFAIDTSTANQVNLVVVAVVPEPAAVVTAIVGLGGFGLRRKLRRVRWRW